MIVRHSLHEFQSLLFDMPCEEVKNKNTHNIFIPLDL